MIDGGNAPEGNRSDSQAKLLIYREVALRMRVAVYRFLAAVFLAAIRFDADFFAAERFEAPRFAEVFLAVQRFAAAACFVAVPLYAAVSTLNRSRSSSR